MVRAMPGCMSWTAHNLAWARCDEHLHQLAALGDVILTFDRVLRMIKDQLHDNYHELSPTLGKAAITLNPKP